MQTIMERKGERNKPRCGNTGYIMNKELEQVAECTVQRRIIRNPLQSVFLC